MTSTEGVAGMTGDESSKQKKRRSLGNPSGKHIKTHTKNDEGNSTT